MSQKISRRELGRRGALGLAALAVPSALMAQDTPKPPPVTDAELENIENQLAKPMIPEAKKLLKGMVENSKGNSMNRKKYKLADCSELATVYHVQPRTRVKP